MTLFTLGWLWRFIWRRWRGGEKIVTRGVPLPAWPLGASAIIYLHNVRVEEGDRGEGEKPERADTLSLVLSRDAKGGPIRDVAGRELVTAVIHTKRNVASWWERLMKRAAVRHVVELRQTPEEILRTLSGEILAGCMLTLIFTGDAFDGVAKKHHREGITFIDATCALIEPDYGWPEPVIGGPQIADEAEEELAAA